MQSRIGSDRKPIFAAGLMFVLALLLLLNAGVQPARAAFGVTAFDQQITSDPAGDSFTQAGGHPYAITTEIDFSTHPNAEPGVLFGIPMPDEDTKDIFVHLPPGELGDPTGPAQCTDTQLAGDNPGNPFSSPTCPVSSQVGVVQMRSSIFNLVNAGGWVFPLYNMVAPPSAPAKFGIMVLGVPITLTGNVRNGGDFGVTIRSADIPIALPVDGITLTFWGVPADKSHDAQRCDYATFGFELAEGNWMCPGSPGTPSGPNVDPVSPEAFLIMPTSCTEPGVGFHTTLEVDSWLNPGVYVRQDLFSHLAPGYPAAPGDWGQQEGMTGCDVTPFSPSISVTPTNAQADTPSGLNVDITVPQDGLSNPSGIASAHVKKAVVTLPEGESVSPSAADGLGGCSLAQVGLGANSPAECPGSSKLGTVEIDTPLLEEPLEGSVFLGKQGENPFGSLVALYVVVEGHGVILKLPGHVDLDGATGRITTTFDNNPQLPFDHFKLNFKAGPRSPLVNPHTCGTYDTTAEFTPWSGNPPVEVKSSFQITSGPEGRPCPGSPQAFAPSFVAGTTNNQAGAFSPFIVTFTRNDGEQQLGGVTVKTPPGLLGMLSAVSLCPDQQASAGSCPSSSEIGSLTAAAGAGANPFYVTGGKVFLTTGYKGAPYGLSVVVPAKAGPFDLGIVVVRGSVTVDPVTTALTVTTDPVPTILDGIPLDLRSINVRIDRPGFMFNPTNCNPLSLSGLLTGGLGGTEAISNSFQVTNCGRLGFSPKFSVTTPGKTSRANGAGLTARVTYPSGPQANIAKVKVNLPKQLPSRLTTLQKACSDSTFKANPGACPAASKIGFAKAITPILPEPLTGPVYFVSHGGAAFPDLVVALKGYGITFDLIGTTFISKAGITSTSFKQVPDVPIGSFELTLPQGPNSALAANGNLCASKLKMPTTFVAQDGAEIHRSTPIIATGCAKHKAKRAAGKHGKKKGKRK